MAPLHPDGSHANPGGGGDEKTDREGETPQKRETPQNRQTPGNQRQGHQSTPPITNTSGGSWSTPRIAGLTVSIGTPKRA